MGERLDVNNRLCYIFSYRLREDLISMDLQSHNTLRYARVITLIYIGRKGFSHLRSSVDAFRGVMLTRFFISIH